MATPTDPSIDKALAIETSGQSGSVALVQGARVLVEESFPHGLKHAAGMLPMIDRLMQNHGWKPADLHHLYVSHGPGSFTGLRIGITLAKTLALVTGAKIVPVPTLEILAQNAPVEAQNLIVVLDAKRDQIFTARYEKQNGKWIEQEAAHLDRLHDMLHRAPRPVYLLGEGIPFHERFLPVDRDGIFITEPATWRARASVVAQLGIELAAAGIFADADRFTPMYVRKPEAEEKYEQRMATEFDFIAWIRAQQKPSELVRLGIGDDLAVLNWASNDLLLVGVDQVLDGVHFDSNSHSPRAIGRKAMNRNLSDCAAMGCLPAAAVATVALPKGVGDAYAKELFLGMKEAGEIFNTPIVGGDTSSWPGKLVITVTILGRSDGVEPITRSGAKPGDLIYVTGPLGGSLLGRHMEFTPRVEEGRAMALSGSVTSMIDLSDGMSRDLRHICRSSGVGAMIDASKIPIHEDAIEMRRDGHSPLEHALHDGEDYELLFTTRSGEVKVDFGSLVEMNAMSVIIAQSRTRSVLIGTITAEQGIWLYQKDGSRESLEPKAWEHTF